jgi:hypothetical protein
MKILAFDFASTTGWAVGSPGEVPLCNSIRFVPPGSSHERLAGAAIEWAVPFLKAHMPDILVAEAPIAPSFMKNETTISTSMILMGLPFLFGGIAYRLGIHRQHLVRVSDVRAFFLGRNCKSAEAKKLTVQRCKRLGWEPNDDNAADACAVWAYQCSYLAPELAHRLTPLFGGVTL